MRKLKRGIYYTSLEKTTFIPAVRVSELVEILSQSFGLEPERQEELVEKLYSLVANYDIEKEFCWLSLSLEVDDYLLRWGLQRLLKLDLAPEAIDAAYYVWSQANCTPEEASKILNIGLKDLMLLSQQFERYGNIGY